MRPVCQLFFALTMLFAGMPCVAAISAREISPASARTLVATVDGQVITRSDVEGRVRIAIVGLGMEDSPDLRRKLAPQMLDLMVDELLQMKKAKEFKIEPTHEELQEAIAEFEQQRGMTAGFLVKFAKDNAIPEDLLWGQFRAQLAWKELIRGLYQGDAQVREVDVHNYISRVKNLNDTQRREIYELFLPVYDLTRESKIHDEAQALAARIRAGASFQALAQEFSKAASASQGGALGVVPEANMSPDFKHALHGLKPGEVSEPYRTQSGYLIVMYRKPSSEVLRLMQVIVPLPRFPQDDPNFFFELDWKMKTLTKLGTIQGCQKAKDALVRQIPEASIKMGDHVNPETLTRDIKKIVTKTKPGHLSAPVPTHDGIVLFGVCERRKVESKVPTEDEARAVLMDKSFSQWAQRLMTELRAEATISLHPEGLNS